MKTYPIPADLLTAIAAELAERPWNKVANLLASINAIAAASNIDPTPPAPASDEESE